MAASCSRTLFFQSGRVEGIIRSICRTDVSTDLASIRILSRKKKETVVIHYNLKIDENPSRLPVPEKPRLRCFDLDPDRLDCLHLSGFRFADHQHYPLQLPRRAYFAFCGPTTTISFCKDWVTAPTALWKNFGLFFHAINTR